MLIYPTKMNSSNPYTTTKISFLSLSLLNKNTLELNDADGTNQLTLGDFIHPQKLSLLCLSLSADYTLILSLSFSTETRNSLSM
jgi:hypothetical protein